MISLTVADYPLPQIFLMWPLRYLLGLLLLLMQGNGALVILRRHQVLRSSIRRMSNTPRQLSPLSHSSLLEVLLDCFIGDFDNYEQVLQDRAKGMEPREGGGHEHIHCAVRRIDSYLTTEQFDPLRDYERHSKSLYQVYLML